MADAQEKKKLDKQLAVHVKAYTSFIYYVTNEEDRFLKQFLAAVPQRQENMFVYNSTMGLVKVKDYFAGLEKGVPPVAVPPTTVMFTTAMREIFKAETSPKSPNFYFILDSEKHLSGTPEVREVLNIVHQTNQDVFSGKFLIFLGSRKFVPEKLQRYVEVIFDKGPTGAEVAELVEKTCEGFNKAAERKSNEPGQEALKSRMVVPADSLPLFKGLTTYEIRQALSMTAALTRTEGLHFDPQIIIDYRRKQFLKSDLIQHVDTSEFDFDKVGGLKRFQKWATKNQHCWTKAGKKFGLKVPRGVLLVGVYGCGKSLAVKALASSWKLPLVSFDMGRLRSSLVGDTETNVYKALQIVESASPCILWMDEAEKGLAGSESSSSSDSGTTARALGILSTWIQENKADVCIAMTANSLRGIPPELVNRMSERFFVDLPDELDRVDIFKIHMAQLGQDPKRFNLAVLAEKSESMVGREIEQVLQAAMVESFAAGKESLDQDILENEIVRKPRIVKTMTDEIKAILDWVGYDETIDDGIRAKLASDHRNESLRFVESE
jgi:SpoVK/Ycf46/Vps4 family AAA+-type ATPase